MNFEDIKVNLEDIKVIKWNKPLTKKTYTMWLHSYEVLWVARFTVRKYSLISLVSSTYSHQINAF